MNVLLLYYTGTFNTRYLSRKIKVRMERDGDTVTLYEIDPLKTEKLDFSNYDMLGLGYPIYGFAAPWPFLKFIRAQRIPRGMKTFIYKNSGETYHDNDASSLFVVRKLRRCRADIHNEYHFGMPYNIHFKYEDQFVKEQLVMNDKLMEIMLYELRNGIGNMRKRYKLRPRLITATVARPQYIGGDVNSFLYRIHKDKCIDCNKCIQNCPTQNIYRDENGEIRFHHHCLMCMRCSMHCPKDAIYIGFLDEWGWRVNGAYNFNRIEQMEYTPVINKETRGFYECYYPYFRKINRRYAELFGGEIPAEYQEEKKERGMINRLLHAAIHKIDIRKDW